MTEKKKTHKANDLMKQTPGSPAADLQPTMAGSDNKHGRKKAM